MNKQAQSTGGNPRVPQCRPYHPLSNLREREGYYPNLTESQVDSVEALDELIAEEQLDIATDEEDLFLKKLRFLRARSFSAQKAFDMLKKDTEMRRDHTKAGLRHESATEVLQCEPAVIYNHFPTWVQGFDNECRPIAYRNFGDKFEIWNILKITSMENLLRFHAWEGEQALRIMREKSEATGYNIETFVVIIDAKGWHAGLATSDAFSYIKGMAATDSDHYPERLGRLIVINAPFALSFAWRIIKRFLDDVTRNKIQILSGPADWEPVMQSFIDRDQIPEMYGGTLPDPTPEDAIDSINPPPRLIEKMSSEEKLLEEQQRRQELSEVNDVEEADQLAKDFETLAHADDVVEAVLPPVPPVTAKSGN